MKIRSIKATEILDSRGNPTIETTVSLENGSSGTAAVPSGASTGSYEAVELRDGNQGRYHGKGVLKAIENIEKISEVLAGMDASNQKEIDDKMIELDGTENKSNLGANTILSVSLAVARAEAMASKKQLFNHLHSLAGSGCSDYSMPIPMMNVMNGGKHANWATDIQEYMIMPISADSMKSAIRMCAEVYTNLKIILKEKGYSITVGDEGGFAPDVKSNSEPFELISEAIEKSGYKLTEDFVFAIDAAANEFYKDGKYELKKEGKTLDSDEMISFYQDLMEKYPLASLEDIFAEDDWESFAKFLELTENKKQVVGDDLYVTNIERIKKGVEMKASNSVLIKLNQIGTLSETIEAVALAKQNKMTSIISHRSGETSDPFIADLAVALGTGQIKAGAPCRGERTAKYNRLLSIEEKSGVKYAKWPF